MRHGILAAAEELLYYRGQFVNNSFAFQGRLVDVLFVDHGDRLQRLRRRIQKVLQSVQVFEHRRAQAVR